MNITLMVHLLYSKLKPLSFSKSECEKSNSIDTETSITMKGIIIEV